MGERSPENKEAPNNSERYPSKDRTETIRKLGQTAVDGANKDKRR